MFRTHRYYAVPYKIELSRHPGTRDLGTTNPHCDFILVLWTFIVHV